MKHSYYQQQQQQQQLDQQLTMRRQSLKPTTTTPSNISIKRLNHYVLKNENLNFNFDEIRQELAHLGVTGLSEEQLVSLKNDLDLIIRREKQLLLNNDNDGCLEDEDVNDNHGRGGGDSYFSDADDNNNTNKSNTLNNEKKKSVYSSLTSLSSSVSCFSITSEEFSNCQDAGSNNNNNNNNSNNNYGEENINNERRNVISSKKPTDAKLSLNKVDQQSIENTIFSKHRQLNMTGQNECSNSVLLNGGNAAKSSTSTHMRQKLQRVTKSNHRNPTDFLSPPKGTNLLGKANTTVSHGSDVGSGGNSNKMFSYHLSENEEKPHSTTDPQLATDILSATMYDMRTSYLLSNDEVKDDDNDVVEDGNDNDNVDELENDGSGTPATSLSSKAFLDDANCRKRHRQHWQKEPQQSNIDRKYHHNQSRHHPHQEGQNQNLLLVPPGNHVHGLQYHQGKSDFQPVHLESRVIKFRPIMLPNPLSVTSSQQTSSITVAPPSCWSSQSYSDLPLSASTSAQDKYSLLANTNRPNSVHCSYTGDNVGKKVVVKQPTQSSSNDAKKTTKTKHRNILSNTEDCVQYSDAIESYILQQSRGMKHDPSHEVSLTPVFTKSTTTTPLTNKTSHPLTQTTCKDSLSKLKTFQQRYQQSQNANHQQHHHQELQLKSSLAAASQGQYERVVRDGTVKPSMSSSLPRLKPFDNGDLKVPNTDDNISPSTTIATTIANTRNKLISNKTDLVNSSLSVAKRNISSASSRRSARFLDDPVDQVHSLPQRPKSSCLQDYQKLNTLHQNSYDTQSAYSGRSSQRSGSSSVTTRRRQDPVARYHAYQRSWLIHSTPGENARRVLRWNIKTAMMHREVPLLQRNSAEVARLLGPYASAYLEQERQRRIKALKLDYVPPTSRRYDALRQSIRALMSNPS